MTRSFDRFFLLGFSKTTVIPLAAALLWAFLNTACGGRSGSPGEASASAGPVSGPRPIHCLGRLLPGEKVLALAAPPQSIVKELLVRRGDRVKRGQALVTFMNIDAAQAAVRQAEAEMKAAEVQLARTKGEEPLSEIAAGEAAVRRTRREYDKAQADMVRAANLRGAGYIAQSDFEDAEVALKAAEAALEEAEKRLIALKASRPAEIELAERRLASVRAAVERARADADLCLLRAPIDGAIIDISAWPGEAVGTRGVLDLGDPEKMMVEAEVYINDVKLVRIGAPARVRGDGFEGELTGQVVELVAEVGTNAQFAGDPFSYADRRVVKVLVRLDDARRVSHLSNAQVNVTIGP